MTEYIYKICSYQEWEIAQEQGLFSGSEVDKIDGYIHFSPIELLESTVTKHFAHREGVILEIESVNIPELVWEEARGGLLFPHLYGTFDSNVVCNVYDLNLGLTPLLMERLPG